MVQVLEQQNIAQLAKALLLDRWADGSMISLSCYLDETGSSLDITQPINGMAGFLGNAEVWEEFAKEWNASDFANFHDKDIRKLRRKEKARATCLSIIEKYPLLPIGWFVEMDKWREWAISAPDPTAIESEPYYSALGYCLGIAAFSDVPLLDRPEDTSVIAVLDENVSFVDDAMMYYRHWRQRGVFRGMFAGPPVFRSSERFAPLRAADCLVGILRDELKGRLEKEHVELESFSRIMELAKRECGDEREIPIALINDDATVRWYLRDDYGEP